MAEEEGGSEHEALIRAVSDRIRELRKIQGLTQGQLAAKAGLKQSYLFEVEAGKTNPTLRTLDRIARALEVSARDLLPSSQDAGDLVHFRVTCDRIVAQFKDVTAQLQTALESISGPDDKD